MPPKPRSNRGSLEHAHVSSHDRVRWVGRDKCAVTIIIRGGMSSRRVMEQFEVRVRGQEESLSAVKTRLDHLQCAYEKAPPAAAAAAPSFKVRPVAPPWAAAAAAAPLRFTRHSCLPESRPSTCMFVGWQAPERFERM
jgi:hypothetical protein